MKEHTYNLGSSTVTLITGEELAAAVDELQDRWGPNWHLDATKRFVMDTLHDCSLFIDHYEDAARLRAKTDHAKAMHKLAASLICPPAADDEPERLRKAGAL